MRIVNKYGFTLVEMMIAGGIMAGLALASVRMFDWQNAFRKQTEGDLEITTIHTDITQHLLNADACISTFNGINVTAAATPSLTVIRNRAGGVAYNKTSKYGNNTLMIDDLSLQKDSTAGNYIQGHVLVRYKKINREIKMDAASAGRLKTKSIPIKLLVNAGTVINCYSTLESAIETAMSQSCLSLAGNFDTTNSICNLTTYTATTTVPASFANNAAVSNQFMFNYTTNYLDGKYLNADSNDTTTFNLSVTGAGILTANNVTAPHFIYSSDARLKENIRDIEKVEQIIMNLHGKKFRWKKDKKEAYGFIAQEVEKVLPEVVFTDEKGMKSVSYGNMVAILVEAIKKQNYEINELLKLEEKVDELEKAINNTSP